MFNGDMFTGDMFTGDMFTGDRNQSQQLVRRPCKSTIPPSRGPMELDRSLNPQRFSRSSHDGTHNRHFWGFR
jgi:hypothetical protein